MVVGKVVIHPVADLFPMLADDELAELADDIKANGLIHAIILDAEGQILDGRNRYAACNLAGVQPRFETYEGEDPSGYVMSENVHRRHMTKGQLAMVVAVACLESKQTVRAGANNAGVNVGRVGQALTVQKHAPDLVDLVIAGNLGLDAAYQTAKDRKAQGEQIAKRVEGVKSKYTDLADRVQAEEITLDEAIAEATKRQIEEERAEEARKTRIRVTSHALASAVQYLAEVLQTPAGRDAALEFFDNGSSGINFTVGRESLLVAAENLKELGGGWK